MAARRFRNPAHGCILAGRCQADARALLCEGVTGLSNGLQMARGGPEGGGSSSTDADGPSVGERLACVRGTRRRSLGFGHAAGREGRGDGVTGMSRA